MIRMLEDQDYSMLVEWWKFHKHPILEKWFVPPTTFISLEDTGEPCMSLSVYVSNGNVALAENLTSRPNLKKEERRKHMDKLFQYIQSYCLKNKLALITFSDSEKMNKILENNNFKLNGSNLSFFYAGGK